MNKSLLISVAIHGALIFMFLAKDIFAPTALSLKNSIAVDIISDVAVTTKKSVKNQTKQSKSVKEQQPKKQEPKKQQEKSKKAEVIKKATKKQLIKSKKIVNKEIVEPETKPLKVEKTNASKDKKEVEEVVKSDDNSNKKRLLNSVISSSNNAVKGTEITTTSGLTESDIYNLKQQLKACWTIPNLSNAEDLKVKILINVASNGMVENARINWTSKPMSDEGMRLLAESSIRAVLNPNCGKLNLPASKYEQWKTIIIQFDPIEMSR